MAKDEEVKAFIEHHGVKGMHWGVRRKGQQKTSSDFKKTEPLRKKPVSALTNKQLKAVNERMNLETNYKKLNPSTARKGKMAAAEIIGTVGLAVGAYNLLKSPAGQAAINAGRKFLLKKS
jgi:hypothetical protein